MDQINEAKSNKKNILEMIDVSSQQFTAKKLTRTIWNEENSFQSLLAYSPTSCGLLPNNGCRRCFIFYRIEEAPVFPDHQHCSQRPIGASIVAMSPNYMLDRNPALLMGKPGFQSKGPPRSTTMKSNF